jgi:uncharacterized protein YhdP
VRIDIPTAHTSEVAIDSGNARARLRFAESGGRWRLDRGMARFDAQPATWPAQPGLLVAGNWPRFDLGEWLALAGGDATPGTAAPSQRLKDWLGPVDVHLDHATVFGYEFPDVAARLRSNGDDWQVDVSGPRVLGRVTVPDDYTLGRPIVLDLERLTLVSDDDKSPAPRAGTPRFADKDPRKLPALDVHAEEFTWSSRQFGRVQAAVRRDARGLVLNRLTASGPDFELNANGAWVVEASGPRSNLELEFTSGNLAAAARALGYRDAIEADKARVTANLWWPGGPSEDAKARLNGTLRMSLEDGQLRDVEPGAGRMLGLLSVGQLPRRLALDFRDVTDEGLAFNSVRGDFELKNGSAYTENLLLKGPALDIGVVGRTGLGTEDYDQTMVVSGNPSGPLAVAGALAAGPVVGAGVLVLSQLFKGQLQGLTRAYYHVSGPWSSPVVERISAPTPAEPAAATAGATK